MPPAEFQRLGRETSDWIADYLASVRTFPVFPSLKPGSIRDALPAEAPDFGDSMDEILADFRSVVVPGLNHWNHPAFYGYFSVTASGPGILGEMLTAALNVNAMVWRSSPVATELEDVTTDWLRALLGLPQPFEGVINDTASSSTLYALAAARGVAYPEVQEDGLFGLPRGRVYASEQAHSSVEKAVMAMGFGRRGYRTVPTNSRFEMDVDALSETIRRDVDEGVRPVAVVATLGTTSTASIDPVGEVAAVAREHGAWLHVDAAYGGPAAMLPELRSRFAGWGEADSVVVNPHKWLFTPIDCSVLFCRRPDELVRAFSLVPEYLSSSEAASARSLMDYGVSLGRRFRSLKLWFVLRYFGRQGLVARIRHHIELARELASWIEAEPGWSVLAPVELAAVAFRYTSEAGGSHTDELNHAILERVNASGAAFITHTSLNGQTVLRVAVGNIKTTREDVEQLWTLLREVAESVESEGAGVASAGS
ncbi:MAG: aminotransferase class I/II-fold pyridoxal phosphate-dependent enzyme [Gemmatimonadetes bacterium]|nr:aminotransferase class I/II-fold pyridoxal phosphate-dependent enzyme [Gemmatimonadota bacterium]